MIENFTEAINLISWELLLPQIKLKLLTQQAEENDKNTKDDQIEQNISGDNGNNGQLNQTQQTENGDNREEHTDIEKNAPMPIMDFLNLLLGSETCQISETQRALWTRIQKELNEILDNPATFLEHLPEIIAKREKPVDPITNEVAIPNIYLKAAEARKLFGMAKASDAPQELEITKDAIKQTALDYIGKGLKLTTVYNFMDYSTSNRRRSESTLKQEDILSLLVTPPKHQKEGQAKQKHFKILMSISTKT
ncbi:hypothetical protein SEMRO_1138_G245380.1 [Seminavis robusta]|uniref:Uncharacterized protein n=1 Tax=Seminavis robusta TaxID=568900 RepID=A0A9N8HPX8_9STRA|nr:hypothetical protein SEMRO_1138_G245380.1 [Seminavis robusta]|eukprot:Sro1138_g245380.1 n/a (251) ;mRNA; r:29468-30220